MKLPDLIKFTSLIWPYSYFKQIEKLDTILSQNTTFKIPRKWEELELPVDDYETPGWGRFWKSAKELWGVSQCRFQKGLRWNYFFLVSWLFLDHYSLAPKAFQKWIHRTQTRNPLNTIYPGNSRLIVLVLVHHHTWWLTVGFNCLGQQHRGCTL